ncbi:MAG: imidazole glycerol phosphate synthase subunit HisH [Acidimicrobiales bacterium]
MVEEFWRAFVMASGVTLHIVGQRPQHPSHRGGDLQGRGSLPAGRRAGRGRHDAVDQGFPLIVGAPARPLIAVLDYGIGNLHSAHKGFEHAGADARLTADPGLIAEAAGVVLPGVGAFGPCMDGLRDRGLDEVARERIAAGVPFFAICIGLQLLFAGSDGRRAPADWGSSTWVVAIPAVKRPQMQWNTVSLRREHPMFAGLEREPWVYFVHSFAAEDGPDVIGTCDYGADLVAAIAVDNVWGAQFHPEKSGANGLRILENFVRTAGTAAP